MILFPFCRPVISVSPSCGSPRGVSAPGLSERVSPRPSGRRPRTDAAGADVAVYPLLIRALPGERGLPGDAVRLSMAKNPSPNPQILFPLLIFFRALSPPPPPCGVFCNPRCIRACRVQRRIARFAFPRPNRRLCCVTSFLFRCSITWGAACGLPPGLAPARPRPRTAAAPDTSLLSGRRRGLGGYF